MDSFIALQAFLPESVDFEMIQSVQGFYWKPIKSTPVCFIIDGGIAFAICQPFRYFRHNNREGGR